VLIIVAASVVAVVVLTGLVLFRNAPAWISAPGIKVRLATYLSSHQALMQPAAQFTELEAPRLSLSAEQSALKIRQAVRQLKWQVLQDSLPEGVLHALAESPLLTFKDDVYIRLVPSDSSDGYIVSAESRSRTGKADFAANAGHLYRLKTLLLAD